MIPFILITDSILLVLLVKMIQLYRTPLSHPGYNYSSKIPEVVDELKLDINYKKVKPAEV